MLHQRSLPYNSTHKNALDFYLKYDFSDTSTLWQDTSGTTQADADNDPVARVDDIGPNSLNITQATAAYQPKYNSSDGGVDGDGSNDCLANSSVAMPEPVTIGIRAKIGSTGDTNKTLVASRDAVVGSCLVFTTLSGFPQKLYLRMGSTSTYLEKEVTAGTTYTIICIFDGSDSALWVDGTEEATGTPGSWQEDIIEFFGLQDTLHNSSHVIMKTGVIKEALSGSDLTALENWLES